MPFSREMPKPFTITVDSREIERLMLKLNHVRFPDELEPVSWCYGTPLTEMKRLVKYWKDGYDWKEQERKINATLEQYTVDIPVDGFDTLNIHFVHRPCTLGTAIPLLFIHGWPGSFLEVHKVLPILTAPASDESPRFHVVALSLPGFGFSEGPKKKSFAVRQYAEVGHKLMQTLGYKEYVTQGGDLGSLISRTMAQMYGPQHCKASHTNMCFGEAPKFLEHPILYLQHLLTPYTAFEKAGFSRLAWFRSQENGYFYQHSTQPQTLGYGLTDSPVGLLAWIYEKLIKWSDNYPWTDDEILTWVSIYWFSREGPTSPLRMYYEIAQADSWHPPNLKVSPSILFGASLFPKELLLFPRTWLRTLANVAFVREHGSGGHFAAYENPEVLVEDLREMFGSGGPAFQVVKGS